MGRDPSIGRQYRALNSLSKQKWSRLNSDGVGRYQANKKLQNELS